MPACVYVFLENIYYLHNKITHNIWCSYKIRSLYVILRKMPKNGMQVVLGWGLYVTCPACNKLIMIASTGGRSDKRGLEEQFASYHTAIDTNF